MNKINISDKKNNIPYKPHTKTNKTFFIVCIITIMIFSLCSNMCLAVENNAEATSANTTSNSETLVAEKHSSPTVYSKSSILMDQTTGQILFEHNAREKMFPASTTKLMTAILTLENCKLTDEVTVPKEALLGIPRSYTIADLKAGETFTVDQLLHVLLIPSANDAANVLACHISGSVDKFAEKMNARALELGCENTHFLNPSGVHNDEHYSTAYDMALIGKYASTFDTITEIATNTSYELPNTPDGKERKFRCTNNLINEKHKYYYENATGLKTGYTDKSKSCIVATAKKDDVKLLCVVLGGIKTDDGKSQRELDCITLFEYGFNEFKYTDLCQANSIVDKSQLENLPSSIKNVDLVYSDSLHVLVRNDEEVPKTVEINENIELPISKGTELGTVTYVVNNNSYSSKIVAAKDVYPNNTKTTKNSFFVFLLVALIIIILFLLIKKKNKFKEDKYFKRFLY